MAKSPIAFISVILALSILLIIRRGSNSIYTMIKSVQILKLLILVWFRTLHQNNCVKLSGDEIVNIISNKLLFKKVEYNDEIISQVRDFHFKLIYNETKCDNEL